MLIKGTKRAISHDFRVVKTKTCSNILLGRDFMTKFGSITFDFKKNKIKLGNKWPPGLTLDNTQRVRVLTKTIIPARTEQTTAVNCKPNTTFLVGDFEPISIGCIYGAYASYAHVIRNAERVFKTAIINVTNNDIELSARKTVGFLQPTGTDITFIADNKDNLAPNLPPLNSQSYQTGKNLSALEQEQLSELLHKYDDIFADNPKRPKQNNLIQHKIVTGDSLPVYQKPRCITTAWEGEVNSQVNEMLNNNIIRTSESPWNSPIILVKKKDNSTRFVCDCDFQKLNDVTRKDT